MDKINMEGVQLIIFISFIISLIVTLFSGKEKENRHFFVYLLLAFPFSLIFTYGLGGLLAITLVTKVNKVAGIVICGIGAAGGILPAVEMYFNDMFALLVSLVYGVIAALIYKVYVEKLWLGESKKL